MMRRLSSQFDSLEAVVFQIMDFVCVFNHTRSDFANPPSLFLSTSAQTS